LRLTSRARPCWPCRAGSQESELEPLKKTAPRESDRARQRTRGQTLSWHRLRKRDLVVPAVCCRGVGRPGEHHAEEDGVAPRVVETAANLHPLLDLRIGESDAVPGGQIGPSPLQVSDHLAVAQGRGEGADRDSRGARSTRLSIE